ncbi:UNVERIFIED_ORG: hypothetical protein QE446_001848 [Rhizobium sp. SORGH_AS260]|nr:hypothetical protein [Rhizobium sp. SORGH_AS_0285]MDP9753991.1 hypothetical protein [Rhizobium sp. SORGH_AS_0260]MDR6080969.1 hypothetical protein [Agrobacterium sp. SORGH_AS_0440]
MFAICSTACRGEVCLFAGRCPITSARSLSPRRSEKVPVVQRGILEPGAAEAAVMTGIRVFAFSKFVPDATCLITCPPVDLFSCSPVLLFSCSPVLLFSSPPNRLFSHSCIFARSHVEQCFGSSGYRGRKRDRSTRCGCMHDGSSSYAERSQDGPPLMSGSYISWRPVRAVYQ